MGGNRFGGGGVYMNDGTQGGAKIYVVGGKMENGILSADSAQMNTTAGDVDSVNEEVGGQLGRLRGVVDELSGQWRGNAKAAFDDLMVRWDAAALKLTGALTDIAENIRDNSRGFDEGDTAGVEQMNRIAAGGGGLLSL